MGNSNILNIQYEAYKYNLNTNNHKWSDYSGKTISMYSFTLGNCLHANLI